MTRPVEDREVGPLNAAPLRLALIQARTTPVLSLERAETVETLVTELAGWELIDRQSNVELALRVGPGGIEQQPAARPETVWILSSPSQQFRAVLSPSSVAVECDRYSLWPDFNRALRDAFSAVVAVAAPARCVRLGLRYVNELRDPRLAGNDPSQLREVLADELVSVAVALGRPVAGSLAELRVREDFGLFAVRHGLIESERYLLDMDAYNEEPRPFDVDDLMTLADRFHRRIESFFAWALSPEYLASLGAAGDTT